MTSPGRTPIAHILALWCYPIKSLQGHQLENVELTEHGLQGDRSWGLVDLQSGLTLTGRRVPELLFATGLLIGGTAVVQLPDGTQTNDDALLSRWLSRDVALVGATETAAGTYENVVDPEHEDDSAWVRWSGPQGSFHDSTRTQVSVIGQDTMGTWPVRRFRPNVVISGGNEHRLVGHHVSNGATAVLSVVKQIDRCVMVTRPQPNGIERDLDVLRTITRERGSMLGVGAMVFSPGSLAVGDVLG